MHVLGGVAGAVGSEKENVLSCAPFRQYFGVVKCLLLSEDFFSVKHN